MFAVMLLVVVAAAARAGLRRARGDRVIAFGILFLGGMNGALLRGAGRCCWPRASCVLVVSSPYRMQRIFGFLDPWADPYGKGYQLSHSLIAFGRGEWFGVGLGASVEKLFYLPEAHTDFLFAVIAEELGFVGVALVIALFIGLVWRAFASGARRRARASFRGAGRAGLRPVARRAGAHQHRREHGRAAHQGPDAAADELRRLGMSRELLALGDAAARSTGRTASCCGGSV